MNVNHPLYREELREICALDLPFEKFRNRAIAITGASGLVGGALLRALHALNAARGLNLNLIALGRRPEALAERYADLDGVSFLKYDARAELPDELRADYIVHAASNAHPLAFSSDPVGTLQANVLGAMRLLERARACDARMLLISSGEIYGDDPGLELGFDEQSFGPVNPMNPRACYPEGKRAAEAFCAAYWQQYGVDALAARLTYTFGPGITRENSRADAQFLRRALAGEDIVLKSDGSQIRSYCYVSDAAAALIAILLRGEAGQAYNVSNPNCTASIREYAGAMAELSGVALRFELPPEMERRGYSRVTRAILRADKLTALGWKPRYDLREGLRRTLAIAAEK